MSDTPRSDEVWNDTYGTEGDVASSMYSHAQDLERELNALKAKVQKPADAVHAYDRHGPMCRCIFCTG